MLLIFPTIVQAQKLHLSTQSDSALYYYHLGWLKIMDEGSYSNAAQAFAKVVKHDPNFLVGLTIRGRISKDIQEQKKLLKIIEKQRHKIQGDERLLLDVFTELHRLMIIRQGKSVQKTRKQLNKALNLSQKNLHIIANKYPDEPYYIAEYLETLHYKAGAQSVLDSLKLFPKAAKTPFLIGYKAEALAELGKYQQALILADQLFLIFASKPDVPKPWVVKGAIYAAMGDKITAKKFVKQALKLDSENIDAQRLLFKLKK